MIQLKTVRSDLRTTGSTIIGLLIQVENSKMRLSEVDERLEKRFVTHIVELLLIISIGDVTSSDMFLRMIDIITMRMIAITFTTVLK